MASPLLAGLMIAAVAAAYFFSTLQAKKLPRQRAVEEINVAISPAVQIGLAAGDSYLASNLAVFRATIVSIQDLNPADYEVLAKVQEDASLLNPAQGDNYYLAQGVLPWIGEHPTAISILERASMARHTDFLPPYFLGFDYMYFEGKFEAAGRYYLEAANRAGGKNRDLLLNHAARFMEKGNDPATAIAFINGLIKATRNEGLKQFLKERILRLERLQELREAAITYRQKFQRPPDHLNDLVNHGILREIPGDPLGAGYRLDEQGVPQIVFQIKRLQ